METAFSETWDCEGQEASLPQKATPLEFLQAVYCNEGLSIHIRLKAAIEAAQYCHAKLTAVASVSTQDFASPLEARIRRAQSAKLIANVEQPPANLQKPPAVADKRFRRA
jgi:hypothetical protein